MTCKHSRVLDALLSWSCCTWISQQEPAEIFHHYYYLMGFHAFPCLSAVTFFNRAVCIADAHKCISRLRELSPTLTKSQNTG